MKKSILAALLLAGLMLSATACDPGRSKYENVTNEQSKEVTKEEEESTTKEKDENNEGNNEKGYNVEGIFDPDGIDWDPPKKLK